MSLMHCLVCRTRPLQVYVARRQSGDPLLTVLSSLNDAFVETIKESEPTAVVSGMSTLSQGVVYTRPAGSKADWCVARLVHTVFPLHWGAPRTFCRVLLGKLAPSPVPRLRRPCVCFVSL
jgi:hypothetical protein